jgi:nucleoid-associated protein YgaU
MAFGRYDQDRLNFDGTGLSTPGGVEALREGIKSGQIAITRQLISTQGDRLDNLAGALYGDGRYWWILAAASNVGWGPQVPPGTVINVPDLKTVERILG